MLHNSAFTMLVDMQCHVVQTCVAREDTEMRIYVTVWDYGLHKTCHSSFSYLFASNLGEIVHYKSYVDEFPVRGKTFVMFICHNCLSEIFNYKGLHIVFHWTLLVLCEWLASVGFLTHPPNDKVLLMVCFCVNTLQIVSRNLWCKSCDVFIT